MLTSTYMYVAQMEHIPFHLRYVDRVADLFSLESDAKEKAIKDSGRGKDRRFSSV